MLINYLLVLLGKAIDTQIVFGLGYCDSSSINTGTMDDKGMFWGTNTLTSGVKVFGMEHWCGNLYRRAAGLCTDDSCYMYYKLTPNTADGSTATSYPITYDGMINSNTRGSSSGISGYIKSFTVVGDTILPYDYSGSPTTYYCDYVTNFSNMYVQCAGSWSGFYCGSFAVNLTNTFYSSYPYVGCSLSFRGE